MLFDLKGKRKRVVQVTYVALAVLFGGSLVLFGTGSSVSGGLIDAITGHSGGGGKNVFEKQGETAKKQTLRPPRNKQAWPAPGPAGFHFPASPTRPGFPTR